MTSSSWSTRNAAALAAPPRCLLTAFSLLIAAALAAPADEGWIRHIADQAITNARHEERLALSREYHGEAALLTSEVDAISGIWIGALAATFIVCCTGPVMGPLIAIALACCCVIFMRRRMRQQPLILRGSRDAEALADRLMAQMGVREMSEEKAGLLHEHRHDDRGERRRS